MDGDTGDTRDTELLADEAVERVGRWLAPAAASVSKRDRSAARRVADMVSYRPSTAFAMRFVDRVIRPEDPATSARQLESLVGEASLPSFLSPLDRLLVRLGARLGSRLPRLVMPIARRRMRELVGHLVVDSDPERLGAHLRARADEGFSLNVNMLGEAVLGDADSVGRHLVTHPGVHAVILTGAYDTAQLFLSWKPDLRLLAETSGKNAMVITSNADIDLAVADLVSSAFGHSGQKCSAASLAICVGGAYDSRRLRRQLTDAVTSIKVGASTDLATTMGPTINEPKGKLLRALTRLDDGEEWLVEPLRLGLQTWTPGVRLGVRPGSWFHRTECFGPVLGLMRAETLDKAVAIQNSTAYGLTGGIHTLDPTEISRWSDTVEVGNAYINRPTTGAVVRRQPFGGWKRSSVGPGTKAGGPNYVARLGTWRPVDTGLSDDEWLAAARASDAAAWQAEFGVEHDPTGLFWSPTSCAIGPCPAWRCESSPAPRPATSPESGPRPTAAACPSSSRTPPTRPAPSSQPDWALSRLTGYGSWEPAAES